jgi:hypothetical protein
MFAQRRITQNVSLSLSDAYLCNRMMSVSMGTHISLTGFARQGLSGPRGTAVKVPRCLLGRIECSVCRAFIDESAIFNLPSGASR